VAMKFKVSWLWPWQQSSVPLQSSPSNDHWPCEVVSIVCSLTF
jgi:hypothetical protein